MAYIRRLASGRWQCQVRLTGLKPISRTFKTKALATTFGRKVEGDVELARKLGAPSTQCPTIGELLTEYLAAIDLRDPNVGQRLGWWEDQFGTDTKVMDIDEHDVDDGLQALAKRKGKGGRLMSGSSINRYKSTLSACLTWFVRHPEYKRLGYKNPVRAESVSRFAENPSKDRFLTEDDQRRLLAVTRLSTQDRMYLLVLMALTTGMRKGELLGLRWSDVDLKTRTARLGQTKNGKPRFAPLTQPVVEELMKFRDAPTARVFPCGNPDSEAPLDPSKAWRNACLESGIGHCRFHDLRHTAASNLVRAGRSLFEVGVLLGHSSPSMTQRYSHLAVDDTQRMVDAVMGSLS